MCQAVTNACWACLVHGRTCRYGRPPMCALTQPVLLNRLVMCDPTTELPEDTCETARVVHNANHSDWRSATNTLCAQSGTIGRYRAVERTRAASLDATASFTMDLIRSRWRKSVVSSSSAITSVRCST